MNQNLLIDAIVRQTMVLIAQLATRAGARTPLSHVANQVFLDLVRELQGAGLGQKIIADMFGMALRTYHERVQRLGESETDRGRTLWEAILTFIREGESLSRGDILTRFRRDDPLMVRSILSDLVDSGLVFRTGKGERTTFRAADTAEARTALATDAEAATTLVWVAVHRAGPIGIDDLERTVSLSKGDLEKALETLVTTGRATRQESGGRVLYSSDRCVIPVGDSVGFEAALFDHFQAVVTAIITKLERGPEAAGSEKLGGSTYTFDIWKGHPLEARVLGLLGRVRGEATALRQEVDAVGQQPRPGARPLRVTFYVGQALPIDDLDDGDSDS